jgi:hypothetical protein
MTSTEPENIRCIIVLLSYRNYDIKAANNPKNRKIIPPKKKTIKPANRSFGNSPTTAARAVEIL